MSMKPIRAVLPCAAALLTITACESERTVRTASHPNGEKIPCVGISQKGKRAGVDYDWSMRNAIIGIVFVESVIPPIMVLHHETFCPIADTSSRAIPSARPLAPGTSPRTEAPLPRPASAPERT